MKTPFFVCLLLALGCASFARYQQKPKHAPIFPVGMFTEISQCQVTGPDTCDYYVATLNYDYEGQRAKVDYVYHVDSDEETQGTLLFRWDMVIPFGQ